MQLPQEAMYALVAGAVGLIFAIITAKKVMAADRGNERMIEIQDNIAVGAMAFLRREYRSLAIFVVGHVSEDLWLLTRHLPGSVGRTLVSVLYYVVPNLERFNFKTEVVHQLPVPAAAVGWALLYGGVFTVLVLVLACWRFEGKDLQ